MKAYTALFAILVVLMSMAVLGMTDPVFKKSYVCPNIQCYVSDCNVDSECRSGMKCCSGCCAVPVKAKPKGKCPNIQCLVSDCTVDKDCNNGMKCCSGCCAQPI